MLVLGKQIEQMDVSVIVHSVSRTLAVECAVMLALKVPCLKESESGCFNASCFVLITKYCKDCKRVSLMFFFKHHVLCSASISAMSSAPGFDEL